MLVPDQVVLDPTQIVLENKNLKTLLCIVYQHMNTQQCITNVTLVYLYNIEFVRLPRPNSIEKKATAAMNRMASTSILIANHLWRETTDMISVQLAPPTWW